MKQAKLLASCSRIAWLTIGANRSQKHFFLPRVQGFKSRLVESAKKQYMTSVRRTCKDQTRKCVTLHQAIPERLWCKWVHVIESEGLNIFLINKQKIKSILWGTGVQCTSVNWIIWAPTLVASLTLEVCENLLSLEMPFVKKLPIATYFSKWWWSTLLFVCQKVALATGRKKLPLTTIKSSNLSRGKAKQEMETDCKLKAQEEEVRRNQVIFSSEPVLCHHVGMQKELALANTKMKIMHEVLLKDPNNGFAEAQHQMFKEKLENLRVGERSNHSTLTQEL